MNSTGVGSALSDDPALRERQSQTQYGVHRFARSTPVSTRSISSSSSDLSEAWESIGDSIDSLSKSTRSIGTSTDDLPEWMPSPPVQRRLPASMMRLMSSRLVSVPGTSRGRMTSDGASSSAGSRAGSVSQWSKSTVSSYRSGGDRGFEFEAPPRESVTSPAPPSPIYAVIRKKVADHVPLPADAPSVPRKPGSSRVFVTAPPPPPLPPPPPPLPPPILATDSRLPFAAEGLRGQLSNRLPCLANLPGIRQPPRFAAEHARTQDPGRGANRRAFSRQHGGADDEAGGTPSAHRVGRRTVQGVNRPLPAWGRHLTGRPDVFRLSGAPVLLEWPAGERT